MSAPEGFTPMNWHLCLRLFVLYVAVATAYVHAEEVEFPEEELARESVLPKFVNPKDVLNRHILNNKKIEVGIGGGLEIDEPFYSDYIFNAHVGYHLSDLSAINGEFIFWTPGLSSYGQKIKGDASLQHWDAGKAPHPVWGVIGNYQFTAYYGKISITKQTVMNLDLFAFAGPLYIAMNGFNAFGGNVGIGQNFYVTPRMSIRFDLRMLIFTGPNAAAANLTDSNPNPSSGSFSSRLFFNNQMTLSVVYLL